MAVALPLPSRTSLRAIANEPVLLLDETLRVRGLNRGAEELLGARTEDLIGRPAHAVIDARLASGRSAFDTRAPSLRMVAAGWAAPPEQVRVGASIRELALMAIDHDGERVIVATFRPVPQGEGRMSPASGDVLTERQREVLVELAAGNRCSEIAEHLGVSETTVRHHIRSILAAFRAHSQLAAVAEARRQGVL
jgi:DNA-binding CsgD family transcriptional regulator